MNKVHSRKTEQEWKQKMEGKGIIYLSLVLQNCHSRNNYKYLEIWNINSIITPEGRRLFTCNSPLFYSYLKAFSRLTLLCIASWFSHHFKYFLLYMPPRVHKFIGGGEYATLYTVAKHTALSYYAIHCWHLRW